MKSRKSAADCLGMNAVAERRGTEVSGQAVAAVANLNVFLGLIALADVKASSLKKLSFLGLPAGS